MTTLKEQMKLLKIKASDLAAELQMEYGHLSTALGMEAAGQVPSRQSVRERIETIRKHLEMALTISDRSGSDEDSPKRKAEIWDSPEIAAKRFPSCVGLTIDWELLGKRVRLDLDGQGADTYRVLRKVTNQKGSTWYDVFGGDNGGMRSINESDWAAGRRTR